MTLDLDAIAREAGIVSGPADSYITQAELMRAEAFAALLLEKVAQNHDEAAKEWARMASGCSSGMYDNMRWAAQQLAEEVRSMAAGMGE